MKNLKTLYRVLFSLALLINILACESESGFIFPGFSEQEQLLTIAKGGGQNPNNQGSPDLEVTDQSNGILPVRECGVVQCPYGGEINHHQYKERFEAEDLGARVGIAKDDSWMLWASGAAIQKKVTLRAGHYVFRVKAWADQAGDETAQMLVMVNKEAKVVDVQGNAEHPELFYWEYDLPEGEATVKIFFMNDLYDETQDRNLYVDFLEIEAQYTCYYVNEALSADCPYGGNMAESDAQIQVQAADFENGSGQLLDSSYAFYEDGTLDIELSLERGRHQIDIKAFADRAGDEFAKMQLRIGDYVKNFDVDNVLEIPGNFIMDVDLPAGDYTLSVSFINDFNDQSHQYDEIELYGRDRNLYIEEISVTTEYQCITVDQNHGGGLHL